MINKIGPYNIIKKISSGGMATVYLATHKVTGAKVAIKLLKEELAEKEKILDRFKQEGLLKLSHKNIVRVLDVGTYKNTPYIVMDYIDGYDLEELIEEKGRLSLPKALDIFTQILKALYYVHSKGIIHRDIKPKNILIDKEGTVKLTDFGIAKSLYSHIKTSTGGYLGAPAYSSPEQMDGKPVDIRSDIYSLGITLYEMLSGKVPYSSTSFDVIIKEKFSNQIVPITRYRKNLPPYIISIINKCIAKLPENRFKSVEEIVAELNKYSGKKTVVKVLEEVKPRINKSAVIFGVISAVLVIIIIIMGIRINEQQKVIENVLPTVSNISLSIQEPIESGDLKLQYYYESPEYLEKLIKILWFKNNIHQKQFDNGKFIPSYYLNDEDIWYVFVYRISEQLNKIQINVKSIKVSK